MELKSSSNKDLGSGHRSYEAGKFLQLVQFRTEAKVQAFIPSMDQPPRPEKKHYFGQGTPIQPRAIPRDSAESCQLSDS